MCLSPITLKDERGIRSVPCGQCSECLARRRTDWTIRTLFEWEFSHSKNGWKPYFITFTYDDDHLTYENGVPVLNYPDFKQAVHAMYVTHPQYKKSFRYLLCGEYGALRHRPHFHCLMFSKYESFVTDLQSYWNKTFSPKAKQLIESGKYKLGEVGCNVQPCTIDGDSAIKVSRYIAKYVSKGSKGFTKAPQNRDKYKNHPDRVYCSRGYGMQRLEYYAEQLKQISIPRSISIRTTQIDSSIDGGLSHTFSVKKHNPEYLDAVARLLRIQLGVDLRTGEPYYASLPSCYMDKLLPKYKLNETDVDFTKDTNLFTRSRVQKQGNSFYACTHSRNAVQSYLSAERFKRYLLEYASNTGNEFTIVPSVAELQYCIQQERSSDILRSTRSAEFEFASSAWEYSQIDYQ